MASDQPSNVMHGALMIIAAMSLIGLIDNFVRMVAEEAGIWQFHVIRSLIALPIVVCFCVWRRQRLRPIRLWAVALRSTLMALALVIYFSSITLMPIAEAGATLFSAPVFLLIFSVLLFGTRIDIWRIFAVIVGFTGMVLVLKPDLQNLNFVALVPLLAGMLYALGQLTTRHLCSNESTAVVLIGFFCRARFVRIRWYDTVQRVDHSRSLAACCAFLFYRVGLSNGEIFLLDRNTGGRFNRRSYRPDTRVPSCRADLHRSI